MAFFTSAAMSGEGVASLYVVLGGGVGQHYSKGSARHIPHCVSCRHPRMRTLGRQPMLLVVAMQRLSQGLLCWGIRV